MSAVLRSTLGAFGLVGKQVDDLARAALESAQTILPTSITLRAQYHITLLSKDELKTISREQLDSLVPDTRHIHSLGVGGRPKPGVYFVVVIWAAGQNLRKQFGLPPKQFHITLSSHDDHTIDKGVDSLLEGQFPRVPTPELLDHLAYTLHLSSQHTETQRYSVDLVVLAPDSHRGFLRLADSALAEGKQKLAMLSYACAYERVDEDRVKAYAMKKMVLCSKETEWGAVFLGDEIHQLPAAIERLLVESWSLELRTALSDAGLTPSLQLEPRESLFIAQLKPTATPKLVSYYKLPRFFRWLIPFHLAIMSTPRHEDDITALASSALGIRHVLTLTEETPLPKDWFRARPVTNTYLPIPNYYPPSIEQMDLIIRLFDHDDKLPLLVHCGGGKGRAGTVAACYMAAFGFKKPCAEQEQPEMAGSEAISTLRALRPGSIETSHQEEFVSKWCSTIWKRQSVYPELPLEPPPCPLEIEGNLGTDSDLFVLVGLPGSGKSWFTKALLARDPSGWTRISQDDSGSRSSCEGQIGRVRGRVLLDRCNTASSDRKGWLELASNWAKAPVCVWFDYDASLCTARAQMRAGHPTLPPGSRVRNAVDQMQKLFVRPTVKEGFKAVVVVRSFAAALELVGLISPPVHIYKFPRTSHLINLGAATSDDITDGSALIVSTGDHVVMTEKIDGANMGFSLSADRTHIVVQNRSHYVDSSTHEQFKKLGLWVEQHQAELSKILDRDPYFAQRYILFGEWMFATHSIPYTHLPDRFLAFDLYDRSTSSWADRRTLTGLLAATSICIVPVIHEGEMLNEKALKELVQSPSLFWEGRVEGVYVKVERNGCVVSRGKVVRGDFIAGNEHWTKGRLRVNGLTRDDT